MTRTLTRTLDPEPNPNPNPEQVDESHQSSKADTSGTAKAISANLATLTGAAFTDGQIEKVRRLGVVTLGLTPG